LDCNFTSKELIDVVDKFSKHYDPEKIFCPWGSWELNGTWHHNPNLKMSEAEQRLQNIEHGYICA